MPFVAASLQCDLGYASSYLWNTLKYHRWGLFMSIPFHTIPYHSIPFHTIPYHSIPFHTIPYHSIPFHTIAYHSIPFHTIPYHSIPFHTSPQSPAMKMACFFSHVTEENLITVELAKELRDSFDDLFRGKFPTGTARGRRTMSWEITEMMD